MCIHQTKVWCNGKTTEIGSGGGGGQPHPWVRQFTQIWPKFNYSILVSIVTILTNIVVILTSMIQYLKNVVTLEVERAGFFKIMSWAEPEFFPFWWAELSRAAQKSQNSELSWAELARARRAENELNFGSYFYRLMSQTSCNYYILSTIQFSS